MADAPRMRTVIFAALQLLPAACASAPREVTASGYPITADYRGDQCWFLIQDMWMSDIAMVETWFAALPAKSDQVDVVWRYEPDRQCIEPARSAVERAGFANIIVRQGSPEDYPDLLRQTARSAVR
ncbi:MAG: hypothetical protein ABII76_03695 [Pseudomonadota bacterium]